VVLTFEEGSAPGQGYRLAAELPAAEIIERLRG
jgi:hypothetical protein